MVQCLNLYNEILYAFYIDSNLTPLNVSHIDFFKTVAMQALHYDSDEKVTLNHKKYVKYVQMSYLGRN